MTHFVGQRIRRLRWVTVLAVLACVGIAAKRSSTRLLSPSQLSERIRGLVEKRGLRSLRWGICLAPVDTAEPVFSYHDRERFIPASNRKLFVTALALEHLEPDYRFTTNFYFSETAADRAHFHGDLIVRGAGDPTFLNPNFHEGFITDTLRKWADAVAERGIRYVHGDLVMDSSGFASAENVAEGWIQDYETAQYAPRVSAVCLRGNCVAVSVNPGPEEGAPVRVKVYPANSVVRIDNRARTGPRGCADTIEILRGDDGPDHLIVRGRLARNAPDQTQRIPLEQPERVAGEVFRRLLDKAGVVLRGNIRVRRDETTSPTASWVRIGEYRSPPLYEILAAINKDSDNHCAEQLFQAVAFAKTGRASYAHAKQFERAFLAQVGIAPDAADFEDGCGLSRANLVSPRAVVRLLCYMARHRYAEDFRQSLAIAGRDGTIANRMGRAALGRVYAKTGQLSVASALSGYAETRSGRTVAFSILVNDVDRRNSDACYVQDLIVGWLVNTRF